MPRPIILSFSPIFWAIARIRLPTALAGLRKRFISQNATNAIAATAPAAAAAAKAAPWAPSLTSVRKLKNFAIATRIRWITPQAACKPWMIARTAPAAGTIIETSFSMSSASSTPGMAALMAPHAILPTIASVIPPRVRRFHTALPRPSTSSTVSWNQDCTAVFSATQRGFRIPSTTDAARLRSHWPGAAATSFAIMARVPRAASALFANWMAPCTTAFTLSTVARYACCNSPAAAVNARA